jgi:hypothetical protein
MVLLAAVVAGLLAGLARARHGRRPLRVPDLRLVWLALIAFLPPNGRLLSTCGRPLAGR